MENRWQLLEGRGQGEQIEQKEKGLMDMDNSVVMAVGGVYSGTKW